MPAAARFKLQVPSAVLRHLLHLPQPPPLLPSQPPPLLPQQMLLLPQQMSLLPQQMPLPRPL